MRPRAYRAALAQDLQNLQPTHGRLSYVSVEGARTLERGEWNLSAYAHYGRDPLLLLRDGEVEAVLVRYITTFELMGALSLHDRFEIGLALPYSFTSGVSENYPVDDARGLGDLRLNPKLILVRPGNSEGDGEGDGEGFGLGVNSSFSLPTGDREREVIEERLFVRRHFSAHLNLFMEYLASQFRVALNAGYRLRPTRGDFDKLTDLDISSGPTWGLALGYRFEQDFEMNLEVFQRFMTFARSPMESILSVRSTKEGSINPMFGIGAGVGGDFSSVGLRVIGGLVWTPGQGGGAGFPMTDRDKDGLIDILDRCPTQPEDFDGQQDQDGCPEDDADQDQVKDAQDRCPAQAEDHDQFEDEDGCPDPDNDRDGIPDVRDRCPLKAETINQIEDFDGCPDEAPAAAPTQGELIGLSEKIFFKHNESIILRRSFPILSQVAGLIKRHSQIKRVRIEGHTDDTGGVNFNLKLSQERADAVRLHLISLGIDVSRLEAVGYGDQRPIASNDTDEGRALNRRVDFRITSGPQEIFKVDAGTAAPQMAKSAGDSVDRRSRDEDKEDEDKEGETRINAPEPASHTTSAASVNKSGRSYAVQVKASYRLQDAEKIKAALLKERFPAYVLSVDQEGQMVHRVRVGPYADRASAQESFDTYQSRFPDTSGGYIVRISRSEAKKHR